MREVAAGAQNEECAMCETVFDPHVPACPYMEMM